MTWLVRWLSSSMVPFLFDLDARLDVGRVGPWWWPPSISVTALQHPSRMYAADRNSKCYLTYLLQPRCCSFTLPSTDELQAKPPNRYRACKLQAAKMHVHLHYTHGAEFQIGNLSLKLYSRHVSCSEWIVLIKLNKYSLPFCLYGIVILFLVKAQEW